MVSRRLFLTISTAIAALITFRRSVGAELLFVRPLRKELPRVPPDPFTAKGKSLVGVAGSGSVEKRVQDAVALIGGFDKLKVKGKTVLVKPNVVSGKHEPCYHEPGGGRGGGAASVPGGGTRGSCGGYVRSSQPVDVEKHEEVRDQASGGGGRCTGGRLRGIRLD